MAGITLRTARQVVPMIYAYTTPEIARHNGWTKIGYTEQSVDKRLKQQTHTPMCCTMRSGGAMPSTMTAVARCSPTTISTPTSASWTWRTTAKTSGSIWMGSSPGGIFRISA